MQTSRPPATAEQTADPTRAIATARPSHLLNALLDAGASENAANRAAEEVATFGNRITRAEARFQALTWMMVVTLVINIGIAAIVFGR